MSPTCLRETTYDINVQRHSYTSLLFQARLQKCDPLYIADPYHNAEGVLHHLHGTLDNVIN